MANPLAVAGPGSKHEAAFPKIPPGKYHQAFTWRRTEGRARRLRRCRVPAKRGKT